VTQIHPIIPHSTPPSFRPSFPPALSNLNVESLNLLPSEIRVVSAEVSVSRRLGHDGALQVQVALDAAVGKREESRMSGMPQWFCS